MTLQTGSEAPSFSTFSAFRPGRCGLLIGGLFTMVTFCVLPLVINHSFQEQLQRLGGISFPQVVWEGLNRSSPVATTPQPLHIALPDNVLRSLAGTYFCLEMNRRYVITLHRRQLFLRIDGRQPTELVPISANTLYSGEGHLIRFSATPDGDIQYLDLYDDGRHVIARWQ